MLTLTLALTLLLILLSISLGPEEPLQQFATLTFSYPACNIALVVQGWHLEQIDHAPGSAGFRIWAAVDYAPEPGLDHCSCTHRTRLLGDIKITVLQSPVVHDSFGLRDREYLCVRGRILEDFHLVPCSCDNFSMANDYGPDRDLILRFGFPCLSQSFTHEIGIARKIQ
jgi:hypothetical protein